MALRVYARRTYAIWYFYKYDGRVKVYPIGYATYIGPQQLVTSRAVVDRLEAISQEIPEGHAKLVIGFNTLSLSVQEIHTWGGIVFIRADPIADLEPPEREDLAQVAGDDKTLPDESPINRIAQIPYVGQEVAYLYGSHDVENHYPLWHYAVGSSLISSFLATEPTSLDRYVLAESSHSVAQHGGPVFLRDGTLVGVVASVRNGESVCHPYSTPPVIIAGFFGVPKLWKK